MLTSGHKMDESGLANLVGKLHPMYHSGYETGSSGKEPPVDLNRVLKDRPVVEMQVDPAKASFRQGYVDGLNHFMQSRGIAVFSTDLFQGSSVIATDDGLVGFVRGVRLEAPNIPRNYNPAREEGILEKYIERDEPEFVKGMRFKNMITQEGYRLGFVVGAAREHGVVLKRLQVPMDNNSYTAFMQGLKGESRPIPFEGLFRSSKKDLLLNKTESPFEAEMRAYEWVDSQAYHAGLQTWLKSQGVQGVETWAIRHPEALRAFKAALGGQTLSEYEPKPIKPDFDLSGYTDFRVDKHLTRKIYYPDDKKILFDEPREPTPTEIARQQGQVGYNLGKKVSLMRG